MIKEGLLSRAAKTPATFFHSAADDPNSDRKAESLSHLISSVYMPKATKDCTAKFKIYLLFISLTSLYLKNSESINVSAERLMLHQKSQGIHSEHLYTDMDHQKWHFAAVLSRKFYLLNQHWVLLF